jgi:UDP-N-acetyl-2-amino-2-deoxyglucuronate dehydrogenase
MIDARTSGRNFAITGVGGYIAPRHLKAVYDTGNCVVAATDPNDSVGVLDRFSFDIRFFREIERFDRHLDKLRRAGNGRVEFVSICSPNHLHDAHVRMALRNEADAICEKPLVVNPWNLDALEALERETSRRVFTILQLRVHPSLVALREKMLASRAARKQVQLTYVTSRGPWYDVSWKGSEQHSGGVALNIGVHFFDLLLWLFGSVQESEVHHRDARCYSGAMELQHADVSWFLSVERDDLPFGAQPGHRSTYRSIRVDDQEIEFSEGFADLHTRVYEMCLRGDGFGIADARPSIELVHRLRTCPLAEHSAPAHALLAARRAR